MGNQSCAKVATNCCISALVRLPASSESNLNTPSTHSHLTQESDFASIGGWWFTMDPPSEMVYDAKFKEPSRFGSASELKIRNDTARQPPSKLADDDGEYGNRLEPITGNAGENLLKQMRAIIHGMAHHLKEDCERCPEKLHQEMARCPLGPIPFGNEHQAGKSSPPHLEAPTAPTIGGHATRYSAP